jgi:hypothetical protein
VDVIVVLVFFSLAMVIAGLVFFFSRLSDGDFDHGERLSLLPLADDAGKEPDDGTKEVDPGDKYDKLDRSSFSEVGTMNAPPPPEARSAHAMSDSAKAPDRRTE